MYIEKSKKPFFSIIVPTYNNEKEIEKCVKSILSQTYTDWELVIVNDGSTDATDEICNRIIDQDNRVNVIHKKNEGVAAARNDGLFRAVGKYVYFVDADDCIDRRLLQEAFNILNKSDAPEIFVFGIEILTESGKNVSYPCFFESGLYPKERLRREVYPKMMCSRGRKNWMPKVSSYLCDKIILRDLCMKHYCRDMQIFMGEESVVAYECMYFAEQVFFSSQIFYFYNMMSESSMHRRYYDNLFENNIRLSQYYRTYLGGNDDYEMDCQINIRECRGYKYVIRHELEFGSSVYQSAKHLSKKMKKMKKWPLCPLRGLSFYDRCFIILMSFRLQYFILILLKIFIMVSSFQRRFKSKLAKDRY